jgi:thymidylate synthase (FAD)
MKVKLTSFTQPVKDLLPLETPHDLIAYCARVSNPENQFNTETADRLVAYLIAHKHWSPLEMVNVCMEITTTRDIARQILRHRSFSFQEFSQRYANAMDMVVRETRLQDAKNRQNSIENSDEELDQWWKSQQQAIIDHVKEIYKEAIARGIAREQARVILPEGNTLTTMYMNGSIRSWIHYIELRSSNGTQKEHQEVAKACAQVIHSLHFNI